MSLAYLPEHAENARLALELAISEATHLAYTHRTLYAQSIDLPWVEALSHRDDLPEKIDAFVSRFGPRVQIRSATLNNRWGGQDVPASEPRDHHQ